MKTFLLNKNYLLILMMIVLALGALSLAETTHAASDVYVATDGIDDPSRGTEAEPYQTISYGVFFVDAAGTVHLAPGTYNNSQDYDLTINKDVTIQGAGSDQTIIDAEDSNAGYAVSSGRTVTFKDLTIQNCVNSVGAGIYNQGTLNIQNCVFLNNHATVNGGGIYNNGGTVNIANSQFNSNLAGSGDFGGAIYNSNGDLTITDTIFNGNQAEVDGGAIYSQSGTTTITGCTFNNNHADDDGGAIFNSGTMTITDSTIEHNTAGASGSGNGGGIINYGQLDITSSSVSYNTAEGDSGAIENRGTLTLTNSILKYNTGSYGGAIYNYLGALTVTDSTFTNNHARDAGGAIYNQGTLEVTGSTIANNIADYESGGIHNYQGIEGVILNFNRIVGNTPTAIQNYGYQINGLYNWWGSNDPDFDALINGDVDYDPWLVMRYNANPTTIQQGSTSTLTADFRYDSSGAFHDPSLGHLPDGTPVTFTTNLGNVGSKSITVGTLNGIAIAILRGDEAAGAAFTSALLDGQTLHSTITITPGTTVSAAGSTRTIGMQTTGLPIAAIILAVLMVFNGMLMSKRQ